MVFGREPRVAGKGGSRGRRHLSIGKGRIGGREASLEDLGLGNLQPKNQSRQAISEAAQARGPPGKETRIGASHHLEPQLELRDFLQPPLSPCLLVTQCPFQPLPHKTPVQTSGKGGGVGGGGGRTNGQGALSTGRVENPRRPRLRGAGDKGGQTEGQETTEHKGESGRKHAL